MNTGNIEHIFSEHLLKKQNTVPQLHQAYDLIWPSLLLLFCFVLLVIVKITSLPRVIRIFQSCFQIQNIKQPEREDFNFFKFHSITLLIIFILSATFFIYKINYYYKVVFVEYSAFAQFLFFLLVVTTAFITKNGIVKLLSVFIGDHKIIPEFTYSSLTMNQTVGILVFPCLLLAELSTFHPLVFLSAAAVVIGIMQLLKWYRGVLFALIENRIGLLQIFAYFCSVEILPSLVLAKFIVEKF